MAHIEIDDTVGPTVEETIVVHAWPDEDAWRAGRRPQLLVGGFPADGVVVLRDGRLTVTERVLPGDLLVPDPGG